MSTSLVTVINSRLEATRISTFTYILSLSIWGLLPKSERFHQKDQAMLDVTLAYIAEHIQKTIYRPQHVSVIL